MEHYFAFRCGWGLTLNVKSPYFILFNVEMLKILLFAVIEDLTVKCYNYCKKCNVFEKYHQKTFRSLSFSHKKYETVKCVIRMCPQDFICPIFLHHFFNSSWVAVPTCRPTCTQFEWRPGATTTEYVNMVSNTTNTVSPAVVLKVIVSIYRSNTSKTLNEPLKDTGVVCLTMHNN